MPLGRMASGIFIVRKTNLFLLRVDKLLIINDNDLSFLLWVRLA